MRSINKIYYFTIRGGILCLLALILGGAFALLAIACDIDNPDDPTAHSIPTSVPTAHQQLMAVPAPMAMSGAPNALMTTY